ncbi:MAG TPA: tail fiber domain-containing protein [Planctomycetota bacterium]|nr:tail fiber domain-containing protein [Planctomycetota bacterium]
MSDAKTPAPAPDSRRDFLKRVMRTAGYVPPAVIALGMGNLASAQATPPAMAMMMMMASDRDLKTAVAPVDSRGILDRLASIPVQTWSYTSDDPSVRHIGPMAQDFKAAFSVGSDERGIHVVDASGVALASIQGLYSMLSEQKDQIARLEARLAEFDRRG